MARRPRRPCPRQLPAAPAPTPSSAPVILINNFDELEQQKDNLKGRIVFYNYPFNPLFVETFQAYGDAVRYRGAGASRAAKYGAIGVLVRSMSSSVTNFPTPARSCTMTPFQKYPPSRWASATRTGWRNN
ncbi:hypothetical protein ACQ86N_01020 [Puia sp. P3]|uniref:hypothetical protein n=1 Tax=Puia sp. P3 TaxID=3423952 RepID=UPI003D675079